MSASSPAQFLMLPPQCRRSNAHPLATRLTSCSSTCSSVSRRSLTSRAECSVCSDRLLRHLKDQQVCWFCSTCRQYMPAQQPETASSDFRHAKVAASKQVSLSKQAVRLKQPAGQK